MSSPLVLAEAMWLWLAVVLIPLAWWLTESLLENQHHASRDLENYADPALLPYLLRDGRNGQKPLPYGHILARLLAVLAASMLVLAMAGPRYRFHELPGIKPDAVAMLVLDISTSMQARDITPDRMERMRQEATDLANQMESKGTRAGLMVFAALPHAILPITGDMKAMERMLAGISTDMVLRQGSNPALAIEKALEILKRQRADGQNPALHLILMTDGDVAPTIRSELINAAEAAMEASIPLHILQIGTAEGASLQDEDGTTHTSRADEALLEQLAQLGGGVYAIAAYGQEDSQQILSAIAQTTSNSPSSIKQWDEAFPIPLSLAMLAGLGWWWVIYRLRGSMP